jgi:hypothetical protein
MSRKYLLGMNAELAMSVLQNQEVSFELREALFPASSSPHINIPATVVVRA